MQKRTIILLSSVLVLIVIVFTGMFYYQSTRFNAHITINHIKVGGLTTEQAIQKLKSTKSKNIVYIGQKQIYDGKDSKMGFTDKDLSEVKKLFERQRTFFPSLKKKSYTVQPVNAEPVKYQTLKKQVEEKLLSMNKTLKAPKDADVRVKDGKIIVSKSRNGDKYDVTGVLKEFQAQQFNGDIHLKPVYIQPVKTDSPTLIKKRKLLSELLKRTVDYKLQDKAYTFKGSEVVKNAYLSKDLKYVIDMSEIKEKLSELNQTKSTLNKNYTFKTHSGSIISVKGESYGWAINIDEEAKRIQDAFEKGSSTILAYNIYGIGWNVNGVGYHNPTNNGIGNTYVEVSIQEQRIWVYKNGKLQATTPVVTGRHNTNEDTPKGVWYIMYKESPSILEGSEVGNPNYSVKVAYWAPFTNSGCGFHDADWRTNWASTAYLTQGSGGCVNTPPSIMKTVYDNLTQYEPVIVY